MRRSIGPLLLIAAGLVLLLTNLGLINIGQLKELFRVWWPLLLVVAGLLQLRRP